MASPSTSGHQSEIETIYPFVEIAPTPPSGSTLKKPPYSVFVNHRGPDVKETLARAIYHDLHVRGIGIFLDKTELELGDNIPAALEEAMRTASLHIAIFSPTYAESPWCLAELSFMLKTGRPIIPVFYDVQPNDLRWVEKGKGVYAGAFTNYQEKGRYSEQKVEEWKAALRDVSYYKGEIINKNDEENLKNIVNRVVKEMKVSLSVTKYLVGLEDAVANFEKFVHKSENLGHPNVQVVGMWGMGGVGKTTLAKELYYKMRSNVKYSSFVADIREAAVNKKLHKKQKTILKEIGIVNIPHFDNIEKGKEILSTRLRSFQILIVLDDVDCSTQLDALLPMKDGLAQGSLIIITTREREALKCWGISSIYKMEPMNFFKAKQLFCLHAFLQDSPRLGFEELATKFTNSCNGLPLSLKVLGSLLCSHTSKEVWENLWHKISKILPDDIKNRLRLSYDALDKEEKQIFLDAACFFHGEDYMKAIAVWEGSGWSGLYGLERLVNKCLLDLDDKKCIRMHDHLKNLGREIANTQSPYRLLTSDQIRAIQKQDQEKIQIRGMIWNAENVLVHKFPGFLVNARRPFPCFLLSRRRAFPLELEIFVVNGNYRDKIPILKFSSKLLWLSCTGIADRNFPLKMENLRVLELHDCRKLVRLWKRGPQAPEQLRVLVIDGCPKLQKIPTSSLCNLEKIVLDRIEVCKISISEECCPRLKIFTVLNSRCLREVDTLPATVEEIKMERCPELVVLLSSAKLASLKALELDYLHKIEKIESLQHCTSLKRMQIKDCPQLNVLPSFEELASLIYLRLRGLHKIEKIVGLQNCTSLDNMVIIDCPKLNVLPSFKGLASLRVLFLEDLDKIEKIEGLQHCTSLEYMLVIGCPKLNVLPSFKGLASLIYLELQCLDKIEKIEGLQHCTSLEHMVINECPKLNVLLCFDKLASLRVVTLRNCNKVENIEGLQHCSALIHLLVEKTCWGLPSRERLGQMQESRTLQLVEPCIPKIQKITCEGHLTVIKKVVPGTGSLFNSSDFPNLSVLDSFPNKTIPPSGSSRNTCFLNAKCSSNANENAIMLCLVINCVSSRLSVLFKNAKFRNGGCGFWNEMKDGIWILISAFSLEEFGDKFSVSVDFYPNDSEVEKKGLLLMGKPNHVYEAFWRMVARLEN